MGWMTLLAIACALAMDALAVAIVTGLTVEAMTRRRVFRLAFHFGLFQALMPVIGWAAGSMVRRHLATFDHWVAFGLLVFVGGRMIRGAFRAAEGQRAPRPDPTSGWSLVLLSLATSIDALAVGLSLAVLGSAILVPAVVIGLVTAALTALGTLLGRWLGSAWGQRAEILGGLILIAIGLKIVLAHMLA